MAIDGDDTRVICPCEGFATDARVQLDLDALDALTAALVTGRADLKGDSDCARATRVLVQAGRSTATTAKVHGFVSVTLPTRCVSPGVSGAFETTLTATFTLAP